MMRGTRHEMLSVEKCREILGADQEVSDKEIEELQIMLRGFVNLMLDDESDVEQS